MKSKELFSILDTLPFDFDIEIENSVNALGNISELVQIVLDTYGFFGSTIPCYILKSNSSNTLLETDNGDCPPIVYNTPFIKLVKKDIISLLTKSKENHNISEDNLNSLDNIILFVKNWDINTVLFGNTLKEYIPKELEKNKYRLYFNDLFTIINRTNTDSRYAKDYFNYFIANLFTNACDKNV